MQRCHERRAEAAELRAPRRAAISSARASALSTDAIANRNRALAFKPHGYIAAGKGERDGQR